MANRERSNSFNTIKYFILNATTYLTNTVTRSHIMYYIIYPSITIPFHQQVTEYTIIEYISHLYQFASKYHENQTDLVVYKSV